MTIEQNPAFPFFHLLLGERREDLQVSGSSKSLSYLLTLCGVKFTWSCNQVGEDSYEVVCPVFCLKYLEIEEDFKCGQMNGKAYMTSDDLEVFAEEFADEAVAFQNRLSLLCFFAECLEQLPEGIPVLSTKTPFFLEVSSLCDIGNKLNKWSFDLKHALGKKEFDFALSYEAYSYAEQNSFFDIIEDFFNSTEVYRASKSKDSMHTLIKMRLVNDFFESLNEFIKGF